MPQNGDGKHYRTFSQAARASSDSAKAEDKSKSDGEGQEQAKGSVVHVKHHGGGKFSVKHEGGEMTQHDSPEDMHAHLDEHFGVQDQPTGDEGSGDEDYSEGSGDALKSILGY